MVVATVLDASSSTTPLDLPIPDMTAGAKRLNSALIVTGFTETDPEVQYHTGGRGSLYSPCDCELLMLTFSRSFTAQYCITHPRPKLSNTRPGSGSGE